MLANKTRGRDIFVIFSFRLIARGISCRKLDGNYKTMRRAVTVAIEKYPAGGIANGKYGGITSERIYQFAGEENGAGRTR